MKLIPIPGVVPCIAFLSLIGTALTPPWWNLLPMAVGLVAVWKMWRILFTALQIRQDDYLEFTKRLWTFVPLKAMELKSLGLRDRFEREGDYRSAKRCEEDAEALRRGEIPPSMERE